MSDVSLGLQSSCEDGKLIWDARSDQALQRQVDVENGYPQPRTADLENMREWHRDGRFGKGFLLGTSEDVGDTEHECGLQAENFITAADTGDRLSYSMGSLVL